MEINEVINLGLVILCSAGFGVMLYFKVKGNLFAAVSELIAVAEATNLVGSEKMAQVVSELMNLVPMPLNKILTPEKLEVIAQYVFDWMRRYADEYMAKQIQEENNQETAEQNNE